MRMTIDVLMIASAVIAGAIIGAAAAVLWPREWRWM